MADDELRFEMDRLVSYDDESLLGEVCRVIALLPNGPITRTDFDVASRVTSSTLIRRFGGWRQALERAGFGDRYGGKYVSIKMRDQRARSATAEDMIAELQRIAVKVGHRVLTRVDLLEHAELMSERALLNRFGTWKAALEAAGLELSKMGRRWTADDYFENLLEVWTYYGRAPTYAQMNQPPSKITNGAYASKFGSWGMAKQAFVDRVNIDIEVGEREAAAPPDPAPIPAPSKSKRTNETSPSVSGIKSCVGTDSDVALAADPLRPISNACFTLTMSCRSRVVARRDPTTSVRSALSATWARAQRDRRAEPCSQECKA